MNDQYKLAEEAGRMLADAGLTLAVAESCTGGMLGEWLTAVPGSSAFFWGGVISYADAVKVSVLGVPAEIIREPGAVSAESALLMAQGALRLIGSDVALAITGVAGPGGGSAQKPVGTTYVALTTPSFQQVEHRIWPGDRETNRTDSARLALTMLRGYLQQLPRK